MAKSIKEADVKPWADSNHPSYRVSVKRGGRGPHHCLGCRKPCTYSAWGPWCHPCNVVRMTRINKAMAGAARSIGNEAAAKELDGD